MRIVWFLGLCCALAVGALACGGETETTTPQETAGAPSAGEPMLPEPEVAPPSAFWRVVLPEEFPEDVPQYPGGDLSDASAEPGGDMFATYSTADPPEKVSAFYRDSLESNGWRIESERKMMIFASKEDRTLTVMISNEAETTQFEVILLGIE